MKCDTVKPRCHGAFLTSFKSTARLSDKFVKGGPMRQYFRTITNAVLAVQVLSLSACSWTSRNDNHSSQTANADSQDLSAAQDADLSLWRVVVEGDSAQIL